MANRDLYPFESIDQSDLHCAPAATPVRGGGCSAVVIANHKVEGIARSWWQDGQPMQEVTFKDGRLDGLARYWYFNGPLARELTYRDQEMDGFHRGWTYYGKLESESCYWAGERVGPEQCQ